MAAPFLQLEMFLFYLLIDFCVQVVHLSQIVHTVLSLGIPNDRLYWIGSQWLLSLNYNTLCLRVDGR